MKTDAKIAAIFVTVIAFAIGWLLHFKVEAALEKKSAGKVAENAWFNGRGPLDERLPAWVAVIALKGGMPVYQSPSRRRVNVLTTC